LSFGLKGTHTTSINLPGVHYPGPPIGGVNHTLVDFLWHATGCTKQTPEWGYTYWGRSYDYGVSDMFVYCMHAEDGKNDSWSRTCGLLKRGDKCMRQPIPKAATNRTHNNTKAIKYWKAAAAHAKEAGWFIKMFDYTCDEPGADPSRYAACKSRANALHEGDRALKVMITAEKPSADASNISNLIDIWSPIINFIDSNRSLCPGYPMWAEGDHRSDYDEIVREGKGLWSYQSCMSEGCSSAIQPAHGSHSPGCNEKDLCVLGTWPSYMIDTKVTFNRVMSWINYVYDIHGELYWGTNAADKQYMTPGNSSWKNQWLAGGNGDGSLTSLVEAMKSVDSPLFQLLVYA